MTTPNWYEPKRRLHFDRPISFKNAAKVVLEPKSVAARAFWPFLQMRLWTPPSHRASQPGWKARSVAYASHLDHYIYRKYAIDLAIAYEAAIDGAGCGEVALAYRKHPGGMCNIHFARDAFQEIASRAPIVAVALDVKGFFDTISHRELLQCWREVVGVSQLPDDHYQVFKSLSRWAWVDREELFKQFGVGRRKRKTGYGAICTPAEFRSIVREGGMVRRNEHHYGIPQGSSMSAVASNVSMFRIDRDVSSMAREAGVLYRRYSDDILLIGVESSVDQLEQEIVRQLKGIGLAINQEKTERSRFVRIKGSVRCDKPLQYLGFEFDGEHIRLRQKTIGRFRQRKADAIRRLESAARANPNTPVRRRAIYSRFAPIEQRRNFYGYVSRSSEIMGDQSIQSQLRRDWARLRRTLAELEDRL